MPENDNDNATQGNLPDPSVERAKQLVNALQEAGVTGSISIPSSTTAGDKTETTTIEQRFPTGISPTDANAANRKAINEWWNEESRRQRIYNAMSAVAKLERPTISAPVSSTPNGKGYVAAATLHNLLQGIKGAIGVYAQKYSVPVPKPNLIVPEKVTRKVTQQRKGVKEPGIAVKTRDDSSFLSGSASDTRQTASMPHKLYGIPTNDQGTVVEPAAYVSKLRATYGIDGLKLSLEELTGRKGVSNIGASSLSRVDVYAGILNSFSNRVLTAGLRDSEITEMLKKAKTDVLEYVNSEAFYNDAFFKSEAKRSGKTTRVYKEIVAKGISDRFDKYISGEMEAPANIKVVPASAAATTGTTGGSTKASTPAQAPVKPAQAPLITDKYADIRAKYSNDPVYKQLVEKMINAGTEPQEIERKISVKKAAEAE